MSYNCYESYLIIDYFYYEQWWIDFTNWGLVLCCIQAWLGAMIVTQGLMVDRDDFGKERILHIIVVMSIILSSDCLINFRHATQSKKGMVEACVLDFEYNCHSLFIHNNILFLDDAS